MAKTKFLKRRTTKKRINLRVVFATVCFFVVAAGSYIAGKFSQNYTSNEEKDSYSISSTDLSDLGKELDSNKTKDSNKKTTSKNNGYVKSNNGKLYADEESAKNASKVGTSTVDTKGGKLTVDSSGKVKENEIGYEVKDEKGNVISSGNETSDGKVDGFEKNEELGGTFEKGDTDENDVIADSNYYDADGNLIISKGEFIEKAFLEHAKQNLFTTKPTKQSTQVETQAPTTSTEVASTSSTINSNQSRTNANGTYTDSYGNVWMSYQDYISGALDFDNVYILSDGILRYNANLNENTNQKVK